jgi:N-acetylglucosaminyl-diphospho-decaprenol L-rhamnosyltransferase
MTRAGSVDVVVVTRDTRELTLRCVGATLAGSSPAELRCIVVDNASSDGTADAVRARWPRVTVLVNSEDEGFARACNRGAAAGSGERILLLNSDAFPREGAIDRLVDFLASHPAHVAAAGCLVDAGTERPQTGFAVRGFPSLQGQVALLVGLERLWPCNPLSRRQALLDFDFGRTQDLEAQPAGACLLVRRAAYEALRGLDEGFRYWFEDVDFVRRLGALGLVAYVHDAVFDHVGGASFARWSRPDVVRARYRSLLRYFDKHHSPGQRAALRALVAALAALRLVALAPVAPARARAYLDVLRLAVRA